MALFMKQNDDRSELQRRLSAELQEKQKKKLELENQPLPDGVKDTNYMRDFSGSSRYLWVWISLALIGVAAVVIMMLQE